ncbi:DUF4879 domain-containing protein [Candidatus Methylobacter oryzae]|nr:DUF4879 domain-containing protein [Candidatus Methylobacter oryzae]
MKKIVKLAEGYLPTIAAVVATACFQAGQVYAGDTIDGQSLNLPSVDIAGKINPTGPAGISYYQVYAVGSSNAGWEYLKDLQTATTQDHGGSRITVVTFQYGYGQASGGTLNAAAGTHEKVSVCGPSAALYYCGTGDKITGYLDYYSFDGAQNGYFTGSASSSIPPLGTWTDSVYIQ